MSHLDPADESWQSMRWKFQKKRKLKLQSLAYLQVTGGSLQVYDWQEGKHMEQSSAAARGVFEPEGACTSAQARAKSPKFTVYPVPTDTISQIRVLRQVTFLFRRQVFVCVQLKAS